MRMNIKLSGTALTAALLLAVAVSTASARRIEISNQGIRAVWSALTFGTEAGGRGIEMICPLTIEGTFHSRIISKVSGSLIGQVTRAALTNSRCTFRNGVENFRILNGIEEPARSLPWHIRYDSFGGALPNFTNVKLQIVGFSFLLTLFSVSCLYASTAASPFVVTAEVAAGAVNGLRAQETTGIPKSAGGILCPAEGFFRGAAAVTVLGAATAITLRLVA